MGVASGKPWTILVPYERGVGIAWKEVRITRVALGSRCYFNHTLVTQDLSGIAELLKRVQAASEATREVGPLRGEETNKMKSRTYSAASTVVPCEPLSFTSCPSTS